MRPISCKLKVIDLMVAFIVLKRGSNNCVSMHVIWCVCHCAYVVCSWCTRGIARYQLWDIKPAGQWSPALTSWWSLCIYVCSRHWEFMVFKLLYQWNWATADNTQPIHTHTTHTHTHTHTHVCMRTNTHTHTHVCMPTIPSVLTHTHTPPPPPCPKLCLWCCHGDCWEQLLRCHRGLPWDWQKPSCLSSTFIFNWLKQPDNKANNKGLNKVLRS